MADNTTDSLFKKLKIGILGTETTKIDDDIDKSLTQISNLSNKHAKNNIVDNITHFMTNELQKSQTNISNKDNNTISSNNQDDIEGVINSLNNANVQSIQSLENTDRLRRYYEYEAIVNKISYCKRALEILIDNIMSPDNISKHSIEITHKSESKNKEAAEAINTLSQINNSLKIDDKIRSIITPTLLKGDYFTEIIVSENGELAHNILTEDLLNDNESDMLNIEIKLESTYKTLINDFNLTIPKNIKIDNIISDKIITENDSEINEKDFTSNFNKESIKNIRLDDIYIVKHKPEYVVRLESDRFRSNLGYLIFPKIDFKRHGKSNPSNYNSYLSTIGGTSMNGYNSSPIDDICKKIISNLNNKVESVNSIYGSEDLKNAVFTYLQNIKNDEDLKIRYVSPQKMIHWRINSEKFSPYGESIFDCVSFDCKLLMALKTATTIKRLTAATDKRVFKVETGMARQAKTMLEKIKETMRKRKISVDSFGSVDSIPSEISTFEDIYLPMIDGKEFIQFDNVQWGGSPDNDTEGLKFIRDNIVGNLGVPSNFLNIEEGNVSRATLTQESVNFARTIVGYQKELSFILKELFEKIFLIMYPNKITDLDDVIIAFPIPKTASYEHEMEYVEQMSRLFEVYKQLGIPEEYLKRKYLPGVNWKDIDKLKTSEDIDTYIKKEDEESGGGFGGGY